jgi:hypothetical protein
MILVKFKEIAMAFLDFLFGSPETTQQFNRFTPQQQGLQNQSIGGAMNLLKQLQGNQFDFAPIAQQARDQFSNQVVPSLAERFSSLGSGGSQNSSAFQGALGAAGAGLESNLAALKSQYGLQQRGQNINLLSSLLGHGMNPSFENTYIPRSPGFLESAGTAAIGGLAGTAGQAFPLLQLLSMLTGGNQQTSSQPTGQSRLGGVRTSNSLGIAGQPGSFQLNGGLI